MKRLLPALLWCSVPASADDGFTFDLPDCPVRLERRSAEPEVVRVRPGCGLGIAPLALVLERGGRWMFEEGGRPVRTISLGRLVDYPEWAGALARAAAGSPRWNAGTGRPRARSESSNVVVADLLNGPAFPEALRGVFARRGLVPCIGSVEKVLVFPARKIPAALPVGLSPAARLPADAQVWLNLRPVSDGCGGPHRPPR